MVALVIVEHLEKDKGLREAHKTESLCIGPGDKGPRTALYLRHPSHCDLPHHRWDPGTKGGWDGLLDITKGDGSISVQDRLEGQ